ncbi:MAG: tyrosine-type recombinase/integrase [Christensenellales bacterium]|jgi:integrase/recombinase XerC
MNKSNYEIQEKQNILKLREVLKELPAYCSNFMRGIENHTSSLTRLNYAYDIRLFLEYICKEIAHDPSRKPSSVALSELDELTALDIEVYIEFLTLYQKQDKEFSNQESGKSRKIASLRSFFKYLYKHGLLSANVTTLIEMPQIHEKAIIRLEPDEVARLLDVVESGQSLSETQKRYHKHTKLRDLALMTLFLGTGIRISELVGVNITDIDFETNGFKITRKGGNQVVLYFGEEVEKALKQYLDDRRNIEPQAGHEDALFLSLQKTRLSVRSVQQIVKKYTKLIAPLKNISPHKLRSTYGTMLYQQTGDIYLVASVLGHKDVNTTKKHYAAMTDDQRRRAAKAVKLRDDEN